MLERLHGGRKRDVVVLGAATGPYTGTSTERLTVTYDPTGAATEKATFTIDAGADGFFSTPFGIHEDFVSTVAEPISLGPTSKDQRKHDGWQAYGTFKSQGDCVSYVETTGKNAPG